ALPTIQYLASEGAKVILACHLGRPKGEVVDALRLDPIAENLSDRLGQKVQKTGEVIGEEVMETASSLQKGDIMLIENVRFHPGEKKNDPELSKSFADLADLFVNDAFGAAHRAHASTTGVASYI